MEELNEHIDREGFPFVYNVETKGLRNYKPLFGSCV